MRGEGVWEQNKPSLVRVVRIVENCTRESPRNEASADVPDEDPGIPDLAFLSQTLWWQEAEEARKRQREEG